MIVVCACRSNVLLLFTCIHVYMFSMCTLSVIAILRHNVLNSVLEPNMYHRDCSLSIVSALFSCHRSEARVLKEADEVVGALSALFGGGSQGLNLANMTFANPGMTAMLSGMSSYVSRGGGEFPL